MREKAVVGVRCISAQIFFLLCALLLAFGAPAHGAETPQRQSIIREPALKLETAQRQIVREPALNVEMLKILPVLEDKIGNKKLLEKSKEKIFTMNSRELHLVASLCEKISDEKQKTVSADIAFLLVTALIVLS